jgi:hypothetical protein
MAKKRGRGSAAAPSRATLKAYERRAAQTMAPARPAAPAEQPATAPNESAAPAAARQGVLPPRVSRYTQTRPTMTRDEEIHFIATDLKRLTVLSVLMTALIVVLAFVVPMLGL